MDKKEILNFCFEKGILLDNDVLNIFNESTDSEMIRIVLEKVKENTHSNFITKNVFLEGIRKFDNSFSGGDKKVLEKIKDKLGLEFEISREISETSNNFAKEQKNEKKY